jgi:hypothetical protein
MNTVIERLKLPTKTDRRFGDSQTTQSANPCIERILQTGLGFWSSEALPSATELVLARNDPQN